MAKDWKEITDDEILNFDEAHTGNMARYGRIMQKRSTDATLNLRDNVKGLVETIYRASQGLQEKTEHLTKALDEVGTAVQDASMGLQVKMDEAADSLGGRIGEHIGRLVESLDKATTAANAAAVASGRHARNLAWATWALVGVTIVLAFVAAWHG